MKDPASMFTAATPSIHLIFIHIQHNEQFAKRSLLVSYECTNSFKLLQDKRQSIVQFSSCKGKDERKFSCQNIKGKEKKKKYLALLSL